MATAAQDILTDRYGTPDQAPPIMAQPMGANAKVYGGIIAITRAGYVVPIAASPQSTDVVWGVVSKQTDNTNGSFYGGTQGAVTAPIDRGSFWLAYSGTITQANVDATVYTVDDQTVSLTQGANGAIAGTIVAFDSTISKVAVAMGSVSSGTVPGNPF